MTMFCQVSRVTGISFARKITDAGQNVINWMKTQTMKISKEKLKDDRGWMMNL